MHDFGSTVLACTPSYALFLSEAILESGIKREDLKLRVGVFGAEPWTENMRREIEDKLRIKAIDIYGLSEVIGPGVASECLVQEGLHINEDHFYPEIIDPVNIAGPASRKYRGIGFYHTYKGRIAADTLPDTGSYHG